MLKAGNFITPEKSYGVYEVVEAGFYRIDITEVNATFNLEPDKVLFSSIKKKHVFNYGDASLYELYQNVQARVSSAKMKTERTAEWDEGVYTTKLHSYSEKYNYTMDSMSENGTTVYTYICDGTYSISSSVIDMNYGVKLEPFNMSEYKELSVMKDTITDTSTDAMFYSMSVLKRRYDIEHIDKKDVMVVTNIVDAERRLKEAMEDPYPLRGFDTETTGTDVDMYGGDKMVGIIIGHNPNKATYFPFRHTGDFNLPMSFLGDIMKYLLSVEDKLVAHNKKFDRKVMKKEGYDLRIKWDTMQISIILNPVIAKNVHSLKHLMFELNGNHFLELDEIFINSKDIDFSVLPVDIIKYYACPDGYNLLELIEDQFKKLKKFQYKLVELECALSDVKADQEYYGIRVDTKKYTEAYRNCNYIIDALVKAFRTLTREDGNINSSQVIVPLIYEKMRCPVLLRTKKGAPSTSSNAIKKLAKLQTDNKRPITEDLTDMFGNVIIKASDLASAKYPALVVLAKYREYEKLKTAFYARFERTVKTGRVFFWVNQNGAATGRQSSPMHQLPPELKEIILADDENRDFWGPDFSQVELRMIAYLAGEKELIELAKDPDNDIHRIIGSLISNKEMWAITKEERSTGKRRNFGVVYLISAMGLATQIFGPGFTKENVDFCQNQLDEFYHKFKRIDRYIKHNASLVQKLGYMETAWYRRRRLFPEIFDPDIEPRKKASILRMANNVPVQGTAADYLKLAEVQMDAWIRDKGWYEHVDGFPKVRMMLSIHDEIIISAHQDIPVEEITEMITKCMETPVDGAPPFFAQPARMDNWEGHSDDSVAMPIRFRDKIIEDYHNTGKSIFKRSYFELNIPDEVLEALKTDKDLPKNLVMKYYDKCSLTYLRGDYVTEYTKQQLKEAFTNYIASGFTKYSIDNYRKLLNDYRTNKLRDYMLGLIKQYGKDYTVVGQKVRHPSLTHELLDVYKKQLKGLDKTHEELITEATRLYIEDLEKECQDTIVEPEVIEEELKVVSDKDKFSLQLEASMEFDAEGNVVYYDDAVDDDYASYDDDPDPESVVYTINQTPTYVWELADNITYDVQDLSKEQIDKLLVYINNHSVEDGFYKQFLIYENQLIDTHLRIEEPNVEEANRLVLSLAKELE